MRVDQIIAGVVPDMEDNDPIESFPDTPLMSTVQTENDIDKAVDQAMEVAYYALRKYINQTINALVPVLVHKLVNQYTLVNIEQEVQRQVNLALRRQEAFGYIPKAKLSTPGLGNMPNRDQPCSDQPPGYYAKAPASSSEIAPRGISSVVNQEAGLGAPGLTLIPVGEGPAGLVWQAHANPRQGIRAQGGSQVAKAPPPKASISATRFAPY